MGRRIFEGISKFLVYTAFAVVSYIVLFAGLVDLTTWISGNCLNQGNDISAYVIAAATLEFAGLTILQQHISRQQDRALEFPDINIKGCELITSPEAVVAEVVGTDTVDGCSVVRISFEKFFPVYYSPRIYRAWVGRIIYPAEGVYNKMKVVSSSFKSNQGTTVLDIQVDEQQYILEAVERTQTMAQQSLAFIYDISWENQLLPLLNRLLSRLYMRLVIRLEDAGVRNENGCSFKVRMLQITKVPIKRVWTSGG